jgi:hypothetical protein
MALPDGVTGAQVTSSAVGLAGDKTWLELTVTLGGTGPLVHAASGTRLLAAPVTVSGFDEVTSPVLPHTDQEGFVDGAGNTVTNWSYVAAIVSTDRVGNRIRQRFGFQLPTGQTVVDLDTVSGEALTPQVTTPVIVDGGTPGGPLVGSVIDGGAP